MQQIKKHLFKKIDWSFIRTGRVYAIWTETSPLFPSHWHELYNILVDRNIQDLSPPATSQKTTSHNVSNSHRGITYLLLRLPMWRIRNIVEMNQISEKQWRNFFNKLFFIKNINKTLTRVFKRSPKLLEREMKKGSLVLTLKK